MMNAAPPAFEVLRDQLAALEVPAGNARTLAWIVPGRLGTALTATGAYEIFLCGPELSATVPLVARHLQHDRWEPNNGAPSFAATRVLLGSAPHFAAMAALIEVELARFDLSDDCASQRAFDEVEPLIELAIRRGALSIETLIGLIAELQLLKVGLLAVPPTMRGVVITGWRGWTRGRDFMFGRHGIEVKATLGAKSRHWFSGVHQLDPQPLPEHGSEIVHLMSFGLVEVSGSGSGQSLPDLVEDLGSLLDGDEDEPGPGRAGLIEMIREYGGPGAVGYDHGTMSEWVLYQRRYAINFARLYSIADPEMRLLTNLLIDQTYVIPASVSFELQLPEQVSTYNPAADWRGEIAAIVNSMYA